MNADSYSQRFQVVGQLVSPGSPDDVEVKDRLPPRKVLGKGQGSSFKKGGVEGSNLLSLPVPTLKLPQLEPEDNRLELIEAGVVPETLVGITAGLAVHPELLHLFGDLLVVGENDSPLSQGAQIL